MKYIVTIVFSAVLCGCGTISGMGKDIQDSAEWTRDKISNKPVSAKGNEK